MATEYAPVQTVRKPWAGVDLPPWSSIEVRS
jgi:hypothetical protein